MAKPWKRDPITAIYARGSKDTQKNSIPVQLEKLRALHASFATKGQPLPPLKETFEDEGISGRKVRFIERPESQRLLRNMQEDDVLLVTRMDRLGRNVIDILTTIELLQKRGVRLIILDFFDIELDTTSPVAKLMLHLTAAVAEFEGSMIATRTKETLDNMRRQGKRTSYNAPRGFKFDRAGNVVEDLEMRMWYAKIMQLRRGGATYEAIADHLNAIEAPAPPASNGEWTKRNVGRTVKWLEGNAEAAAIAGPASSSASIDHSPHPQPASACTL